MSERINLVKGENVLLNKVAPGITRFIVGLGWSPLDQGENTADLDAMAFELLEGNKVRNNDDFIFYGMKKITENGVETLRTADGAIEHSGDNLTGAGAYNTDKERITVSLGRVAPEIQSVKFLVDIYEASQKNQNFGQVKNAYVRLINAIDNQEVLRYDLTEDYSGQTDVMVAELYRHNGEWKFRALGEGSKEGSAAIARGFGVTV